MKRTVLLLALALVFANTAQAQWTEIPQMPAALNWGMTAELNGTFYFFGGVDNSNNASKTVYTYTPGDAAWKSLSVQMPKGKFAGYAGVVNGKVYIVGGMIVSGTSFSTDNTTYEFDPVAGTFTTKKAIPLKTGFFAGAAVGGKIYVINGSAQPFSGSDNNVAQIYDPVADAWTEANTTPDFSNRLAASAVLNGNVYVMGGAKDNFATYSADVWKGTPTGTDITWTQVSALPVALDEASAGAAGGKIVFTAGTNNAPPAGYSNTYIYDDATDTWTTSYALPIATFNCAQLFGTGNDLYLAGGYQNQRAFKFTVSNVQQSYAVIPVSSQLITLAPNQTKTVNFTAQNLGVTSLSVDVTIPDSAKNWLSAQAGLNIDPLATNSFSLAFTSGTMKPGLYSTTATVVTNDPAHTNIPISVKLYVLPGNIQPQPMNVLLEEGTGNWCGYCPQGTEVIEAIKPNYPGQFFALAYHAGQGVPSTDPMNIKGCDTLVALLGLQGFPNAAIQRRLFPGEPLQMTNRGVWQTYVSQILDQSENAPVALKIMSYSFNKTTKKLNAVIRLTRTFAMTNDPNASVRLTTVVSEDSLSGQQEDYRLPSPYWTAYHWQDIVRQIYPDVAGGAVNLPSQSIEGNIIFPGDSVDVTVSLTVPNTIKADSMKNCNVTFFANMVQGTALGEVLQAQRIPLLQSANAVKDVMANNLSLGQNVPNPVTATTEITYDLKDRMPVTLTVHDLLGREVGSIVNATQEAGEYSVHFDASKLPSGTYIYTLNAGGNVLQKTMTVTK